MIINRLPYIQNRNQKPPVNNSVKFDGLGHMEIKLIYPNIKDVSELVEETGSPSLNQALQDCLKHADEIKSFLISKNIINKEGDFQTSIKKIVTITDGKEEIPDNISADVINMLGGIVENLNAKEKVKISGNAQVTESINAKSVDISDDALITGAVKTDDYASGSVNIGDNAQIRGSVQTILLNIDGKARVSKAYAKTINAKGNSVIDYAKAIETTTEIDGSPKIKKLCTDYLYANGQSSIGNAKVEEIAKFKHSSQVKQIKTKELNMFHNAYIEEAYVSDSTSIFDDSSIGTLHIGPKNSNSKHLKNYLPIPPSSLKAYSNASIKNLDANPDTIITNHSRKRLGKSFFQSVKEKFTK